MTTNSICISPETRLPNKSETLKQACSPPSSNEVHIESSPLNSDRIASPCDSDSEQEDQDKEEHI